MIFRQGGREIARNRAQRNLRTKTKNTKKNRKKLVLEGKALSLREQGYGKQPNAAKALTALTSHYGGIIS